MTEEKVHQRFASPPLRYSWNRTFLLQPIALGQEGSASSWGSIPDPDQAPIYQAAWEPASRLSPKRGLARLLADFAASAGVGTASRTGSGFPTCFDVSTSRLVSPDAVGTETRFRRRFSGLSSAVGDEVLPYCDMHWQPTRYTCNT